MTKYEALDVSFSKHFLTVVPDEAERELNL